MLPFLRRPKAQNWVCPERTFVIHSLKNTMLGTMGWPKVEIYDFDDPIVLEISTDIVMPLDS